MKKIFFTAALIFCIIFSPKAFATQIIPGKQIEVMTLQKVESILAERGEYRKHEIFFVRPISDISLPNGVIDIKIILPSDTLNYAGMTSARAQISINNKPSRDISFALNLKVYDNVIVANHDLRIEVPVTAADFRMAEVAIDGRTEYIRDVSQVAGLVPHRFIRAGLPVAINYFQQPVAVESGTPVRILARYNGLQVSAKGIAMTRGRIGQVIKVKNEASQKILSGRLIDSQTVEVVF